MHPTVMAALATQRHAELLGTAAQRRRTRLARAARPARRTTLAVTTGRLLREPRQQLETLVTARPAPEPCCA